MNASPKFQNPRASGRGASQVGFFFLVAATVGFLAPAFFSFVLGGFEEATKMPLHYYETVFAFLCLCVAASQNAKEYLNDRYPIRLLIFAVPVILLALYNYAFSLEQLIPAQADESIKRPLRLCFGLMLFFCTYHLCRQEGRIRTYITALDFMILASSVIVLFEFTFKWMTPWSRYAVYDITANFHPSGLEGDYVNLTYSIQTPLTMAVASSLAMVFGNRERPYGLPNMYLTLATAGLGSLAIICSSSRSGLLGLVGSILIGSFLFRKFLPCFFKPSLIGIIVCAPLLAIILPYMEKEGGSMEEDARLGATYAAYGPIIMTRPFGVPNLVFDPVEPVATQISTSILWEAATKAQDLLGITIDSNTRENAFKDYPHNVLMTIAIDLGWIGLFSFCLIYFYALRPVIRMIKSADGVARITGFVMFSGVLSVLINSAFHNSNILQTEPRNWIYLGLALRFAKNLGGLPMASPEPRQAVSYAAVPAVPSS